MTVGLERVGDRGHGAVPPVRREPVHDDDRRAAAFHPAEVGGQAAAIRGEQRERL
jgi:hypothetical protein